MKRDAASFVRDRDLDLNGSLEQRLYVQQDANFNVTALTNASGAVQERFIYDPYGSATYLNPDWTVDSGGSDFDWVYLHQGGRWHAESGLYHFRHRDFDPVLGRWVQQDPHPVPYVDGMNVYEYVNSGPSRYVDPVGLALITVGIGGLVGYAPEGPGGIGSVGTDIGIGIDSSGIHIGTVTQIGGGPAIGSGLIGGSLGPEIGYYPGAGSVEDIAGPGLLITGILGPVGTISWYPPSNASEG